MEVIGEILDTMRESEEEERKRIIEIIKSHIGNTYPINCKAIIEEINDANCEGDVE